MLTSLLLPYHQYFMMLFFNILNLLLMTMLVLLELELVLYFVMCSHLYQVCSEYVGGLFLFATILSFG